MPSTSPEPIKQDTAAYRTPVGVSKTLAWKPGRRPGARAPGRAIRVGANADWILVREHGIPIAEVFFVSYEKQPADRARPLMFLLNGGPGAASAFLHMGTAGPRRVEFAKNGRAIPPPVRVTDNAESWLAFADLVFVDPVGTGLSRTVHESRLEQQGVDSDDKKRDKRTKDLPEAKKGFFKVKRDIDILCEFISAFLSRTRRWDSPVFIAGESYGGFRVGKLVRALPERGIGLAGAIMVSPAVDFLGIAGADYDILAWMNSVPTMSIVARHHKRARGRFASLPPDQLRAAAESFALEELSLALLRGERSAPSSQARTWSTLADMIGLPRDLVARSGGRIPIELFSRELLRDQNLICGLYDGTITGPNVFPDREGQPNPDPTLGGIMSAFTAGVNVMLRSDEGLGLRTQREYLLLNEEVNKQWADDRATGYWQRQLECADDLRYGLALNPDLRVLIVHGRHDLVTTYFSSAQSVASLRLPTDLRKQVQLINYDGGHMFYTWERSRIAVQRDVARTVHAR
jgi:carboxypeptidase C (cathepsin A)